MTFSLQLAEVEAKGHTDRMTQTQLSSMVNKPSLTALTQRHTPDGCLPFWMTEKELADLELVEEDIIKLRTKGDGPFIGNKYFKSSFSNI